MAMFFQQPVRARQSLPPFLVIRFFSHISAGKIDFDGHRHVLAFSLRPTREAKKRGAELALHRRRLVKTGLADRYRHGQG